MTYVFPPHTLPSLAVNGTRARFPVNEIYCVGRNYADHAIEMGSDPDREPPFFFMKAGFSLLEDGGHMDWPGFSEDVHHEVELVVALGPVEGRGSENPAVAMQDAMSLVYGYAVGIDMTRRDLQAEAKDKARPWEAGKTFLHAAPCSDIRPIASSGEVNAGEIYLEVNGERRQSGDINQMIWKVPEIISRLSALFVLAPGDLIYTGTPAGVGPVAPGDRIDAAIAGVGHLSVGIGQH